MRIHKLTIKNIASLKGRHHINFDTIADATNLFAITGATGSGKSTLLNCISLALYGNVYKKGSSSADFVTMGEAQGEIQLEFSHHFKNYLVEWKLKLKKSNGEYLKTPKPTRNLYLCHKKEKEALDSTVEDLIKLNFNQFCKTSILNQGEFAKFLKSSFIDRKDILEKFYNGENLSLLGQKLKEKINNENSSVDQLENQVIGIKSSLSNTDVTADDVKKNEQKYLELDSCSKELGKFSSSLQELKAYLEKSTIQMSKLAAVEKELIHSQGQLNNLQKEFNSARTEYQNISNYLEKNRNFLREAAEKASFKKQLHESMELLTGKQEKLIAEEKNQKEELRKFNVSLNQAKDEIEKISEDYPLVKMFDSKRIGQSFLTLTTLFKSYTQAQESLQEKLSQEKLIKSKIASLAAESSKIKEDLKANSIEELKKEFSLNKQRVEGLQQLHTLLNQAKVQREKQEKKLFSLKSFIKETEKALKTLYTEGAQLQNNLDTTTASIEGQKRLHYLEKFIEESLQNSECVVCGSQVSDIEKNEKESHQLQELAFRQEEEQQQLEDHQTKVQHCKLRLIGYQKDYQTLSADIQQESARALSLWQSEGNLPFVEQVLKGEAISILTTKVKDLQELHNKLQGKIDFYLQSSTKAESLKSHLQDQQGILKQNEIDLKNRNERIKEITTEKVSLLKGLKLNQDEQEALILLKYSSEQAEINDRLNGECKQLKIRIESKESSIKNTIDQAKEINSELSEIKRKLEITTQYFEENQIDFNPVERLQYKEEELNQSKIHFESTRDKLQKVQISHTELKSKFENIQELKDQIIKKIDELKVILKDISEQTLIVLPEEFIFFQPILKKIANTSHHSPIDLSIFSTAIDEGELFFVKTKKILSDQKDQLTQKQVILKQIKENKEKVKNLEQQIFQINSLLKNYENLNILLGKDEFRNYVLSLIENQLIEQTNFELNKLCNSRYRLVQTHKTNRAISEFMIVDHFYGGQSRKVSTLSGGETFLVSLALALALAEMTRGQTQIDSLFIDEGFGTLDGDSIEEVLELLEDIQSGGKQIGIISHVEKLTSRIPVNINLIKGSDGLSDIEIAMN